MEIKVFFIAKNVTKIIYETFFLVGESIICSNQKETSTLYCPRTIDFSSSHGNPAIKNVS
jgi:hypothetical protein